MTTAASRRVRISEIERVAANIRRFRFTPIDGAPLPVFSGGSHIIVTMRNGDRVWRNPYSLMSSPDDPSSYQISVLKVDRSRGGSHFMHDSVRVGTELEISSPVNLFPVNMRARRHLFIAGGIGITPFMSMARDLVRNGADFELHYGVRSTTLGAYTDLLQSQYGSRVRIYLSESGETIPLARILDEQPLGTHMYVCGPKPMIDWALESAVDCGWPKENLHSEQFNAPVPGKPFHVKLLRSGREILVSPQQSILEALEQHGIAAPYLCRGGACGQCETRVVARNGKLLHNDHYLTDDEKSSGEKIMICVSRAEGGSITIDL
jgi:ferredoxin-NADP reductase